MSGGPYDFFTRAADLDGAALLAAWAGRLPESVRLLGVSAFGDLFLEGPDGAVRMLDLVSGGIRQVAVCREEFDWGLSDDRHRDEWLLAGLGGRAARAGLRPGPGQCLAFRTPPVLGGQLAVENLVVWDLYAYHAGLAKLLPQVRELPPGTEVRARPGGEPPDRFMAPSA